MKLVTSLLMICVIALWVHCSSDSASNSTACGTGEPVDTSSGYQGELYDTHTHHDEDCVPKSLNTLMDDYDVASSIIFTPVDPDNASEWVEDVADEFADYPGKFTLFFHVNPQTPSDNAATNLENVFEADEDSIFKGFGELGLYRSVYDNSSFTDAPWPDVMELMENEDTFIMLHFGGLNNNPEIAELDTMMTNHPNTKVLLHGDYDVSTLTTLMNDHENLYFTLDTSILLVHDNTNIMFTEGEENEFLEVFEDHYDDMQDAALTKWKTFIEAFPTRVMWGTDVAYDWHTQPNVYSRLIQFSRDFIDELDEDVQTKYAHENAQDIFGSGYAP